MSVIWRKMWRDIAHDKARTILVVLSTAGGVCALGLLFGLSGRMRDRMTTDHRASAPAHVTLRGAGLREEDVGAARREPDVAEAEGETYVSLRWKLPGESEWRNSVLVARADYSRQRMNLVGLVQGRWPGERTLAVERQSSRYFSLGVGTSIIVKVEEREERVPIDGIVRMPAVFPPQFGGDATFFATPKTTQWLTGLEGYNQLGVRLKAFDKTVANRVAKDIQRRLEHLGRTVAGHAVSDPNVHWMQDTVNTLFLILAVLGALSLGLSAFLIINSMNALMAQQVWQIGILKVIGATYGHIVRVYLLIALSYGVLGLLIAIPAGAVGAHWLAGRLLDLINIDQGPFYVPPTAIAVQLAMGLAVPLLAALLPVISGARIGTYRAISSRGLGSGFSPGRLERILERVRHLPRPLALSLRNTFRHRVRIGLTLLTLASGGVIFIMVMSVSSSLEYTLDVVLRDFGSDVVAAFDHPRAATELRDVTQKVAGVKRAEAWDYQAAQVQLGNGERRDIFLWGLPPDSQIFRPRIVSGRGLRPDDDLAILLNRKTATDMGIRPGDRMKLVIGERESSWTVVGLVLNLNNNQRDSFVPLRALAREALTPDQATVVMAQGEQHDAANQQALAKALRAAYAARKFDIDFVESASEMQAQNRALFNVITYLMLSMAAVAAVVSSIGLMGAMSLNVIERRREIGVLRAVGATSAAIVGIFVTEGVLVGLLSWLLAVPLSHPSARLFSRMISNVMIPLDFSYSTTGMLLWLAIVVVLSIVASLWPALRATRISVRESLSYE